MTRENKLALVIGFGLILLVGILVSDHFSAAQRQESAQLAQIADPLDAARWDNPELIAYRSGLVEPDMFDDRRAPPVITAPETRAPARPQTGPDVSTGGVRPVDPIVSRSDRTTTPAARVLRPEPAAPQERTHEVQTGEALARICRRYYDDASLTNALAAFNGIDDPDHVSAGRRLRLPDASLLRTGASAPAGRATPATQGRYTVQEGDSLSEIAQKLMGSGRRYLKLYEFNKDVLKSPDALRPGMVLRIPDAS